VEHTVTEEVTGVDIVQSQIRIAGVLPECEGVNIAPPVCKGHCAACM